MQQKELFGSLTMGTALDVLREQWRDTVRKDGGHCPCCDRWGKVYKRNINETMARSVIWLAGAPCGAEGWVDVPSNAPRWLVRSNQLATLRWWGLVERREPSEGEDKKYSGMWRCTELGKQWIAGNAKVHQSVWTYAGEVESLDGPMVSVSDCLGQHFSYQETMEASMANTP